MAKSKHKRMAMRTRMVTARDVKEGARIMRSQGKAAHTRWLRKIAGRKSR